MDGPVASELSIPQLDVSTTTLPGSINRLIRFLPATSDGLQHGIPK